MAMQTQLNRLPNLLWINITNPEIGEVRKLLAENALNESLAEEIVEPTLRAKADTLRNAIYLTLHFPIKRGDQVDIEEVDFLIKSNVVITSQYKEIPTIKNFVENLSKVVVNTRHNNQTHGGVYFVHFLKDIYKEIETSLNKLNAEIKDIEKNIFQGDERKTISEIANTSRKVFDIRSSLKLHKEVIRVYGDASQKIFGIEYGIYVDIINESYDRILSTIENLKDMLEDLKDTTNFLISNRTNQIVKVFTVVSFVILPMTFLAGFFGMNTKFPTDLVSSPYGTVYIMGVMFFVSVCVLLYLHFKKLI
jgi:magnesium transporter